jgi:hypothetical protein
MRPIAPRTGAPEVTVAEHQHEFATITAARYEVSPGEGIRPMRTMVLRYTMSPEERAQIAAGEDIYIAMLGGVVAHSVHCGLTDWMRIGDTPETVTG